MQADDTIMTKCSGLTLDDNVDGDDSSHKKSVLELSRSSDSDSGDSNPRGRKDKLNETGRKASKKDQKVKQSFIKAYRVNDPLELKPHQPRTSTGNFFNPNAVCKCDDTQMMQTFHLTQLQASQSEVWELRMCLETLSNKLNAETHRADKAETQLELYQNFSFGSCC